MIVAVNGTSIAHAEDLGRIIGNLKPGETADLEVIRDGERKTVKVELENRPTAITRP